MKGIKKYRKFISTIFSNQARIDRAVAYHKRELLRLKDRGLLSDIEIKDFDLELYTDADERRMNLIGQNGNSGYDPDDI
jgi:hypothetical protein